MEFLQKVDSLFFQLQFCLAIDPEPKVCFKNKTHILRLEQRLFQALLDHYHIDHLFVSSNKIIELKELFIKENITTDNALSIIESYKKKHWDLDEVVVFDPVKDLLYEALESEIPNCPRSQKSLEFTRLCRYYQRTRNKIFKSLINEIQWMSGKESKAEIRVDKVNFQNNFDNNLPTDIYNHFKSGLVDKGYLTEKELKDYLRFAFELKEKPKVLFKLKHTPTKQKIYTIFYEYYKVISQKKHNRQKEYVALLGDYFEGYENTVIGSNWAKGYKAKR